MGNDYRDDYGRGRADEREAIVAYLRTEGAAAFDDLVGRTLRQVADEIERGRHVPWPRSNDEIEWSRSARQAARQSITRGGKRAAAEARINESLAAGETVAVVATKGDVLTLGAEEAARFRVRLNADGTVSPVTPPPAVEFAAPVGATIPDLVRQAMRRGRERPPAVRAFVHALHDNTPGDDGGRALDTAMSALEALIDEVYGKEPTE